MRWINDVFRYGLLRSRLRSERKRTASADQDDHLEQVRLRSQLLWNFAKSNKHFFKIEQAISLKDVRRLLFAFCTIPFALLSCSLVITNRTVLF